MIDTDKLKYIQAINERYNEGHPCKWCGYYEDTSAWHHHDCPIFDDPMMKHHIAEVKRLREATQQIIGNIELWCNGNTVPKDILMEKLKEMIE